ncbi:hypothetical protein M0R45_025881 [Rubus argutus]|uniref:Uncharacterized protein n=1 Tax=Rubus argutus TaxID=59490 RepID=A0AAW1WXP1_RUBAR
MVISSVRGGHDDGRAGYKRCCELNGDDADGHGLYGREQRRVDAVDLGRGERCGVDGVYGLDRRQRRIGHDGRNSEHGNWHDMGSSRSALVEVMRLGCELAGWARLRNEDGQNWDRRRRCRGAALEARQREMAVLGEHDEFGAASAMVRSSGGLEMVMQAGG